MSLRMRVPGKLPLVSSFLSIMDLKLGVSIISLFAVLNKVAGVYGMLAVFTGGAEGIQLSMYLYSIGTLIVFVWGLKKIGEEDGSKTLIYAHLFALDHFLSTIWTSVFAVMWWFYVPHDGRRIANSDAQKEMMGDAAGKIVDHEARKKAAEAVWTSERGFSAGVLVLGWLLKLYFVFCLYSFALHLRRGTYYSLPLSRPAFSRTRQPSSGGAHYSHLRGSSTATIDDGMTSTLAETLWEDEDNFAERTERIRSGENASSNARGTGMTRTKSGGGVSQRNESISGQGGQGSEVPPQSPFVRILSRLSGEDDR